VREVNWLRLGRDALVVLGIVFALYYWQWLLVNSSPVDAAWYWHADPHNLYPHPELAERNGYNYSPAFEYVIGWGRLLSFEAFSAVWRLVLLGALVYMAGPFTLFALLTVPVGSEVNAGNIQILLALSIVVGFRWSAAWAFVLLTKVSPGVGLLWFAIRRQWRMLGVAIGVTAAIALVSFVQNPDAWRGWIALITDGQMPSVKPYYLPLTLRLPFALVLVAAAGMTGKRWPVVVGAMLALPVFYEISPSILVGVLPFAREALGRLLLKHGWTLERGHRARVRPPIMQEAAA
jgi:hypothetical protein